MATPLEISVGRDPDGVPVVVAVGEIDMSNAMQFREALAAAAADAAAAEGGGTGDFVVDLTGIEYLDSAGINALFAHVSRVRLIAAPLLVPVLTVAGLTDVLSVHEPSELVWRF
jgi:anti-sigma B factor antagonist